MPRPPGTSTGATAALAAAPPSLDRAPIRARVGRRAHGGPQLPLDRALATAVRQRAPAPLLQRLVGFEAEFSVPSLPQPPAAMSPDFQLFQARTAVGGGPPTAAIEGFLAGGLPYGSGPELGPAGAHFRLAADHNALQTRHRAIRAKLEQLGFNVPDLAQTMSNLEYVTPAEDELAAGSTALIRGHLDAIAAHARGVVATAKTTMTPIPAPAVSAYCGFPEADFRAWLGNDYAAVAPSIEAFKGATRDSFYLQATVGIIPSAFPALFRSRGSWVSADNAYEDIADRVNETMKGLLHDPAFTTNAWIAALKQSRPIDYEGFVGMLYLIYSYMVGHAINQTNLYDGSSEKNAVPFMSKLTNLGTAMTTAVPTFIRATGVDAAVVGIVDTYFKHTEYVRKAYWKTTWNLADTDPRYNRGPVLVRPNRFVGDVLTNTLPLRSMIGSPRSYPAPDPTPASVTNVSGDQQGIQVEYRHITVRPDADGLAAALMKVVDEVRELNTKHLGYFDKRALLKAADR